jgi:hypothetical protein
MFGRIAWRVALSVLVVVLLFGGAAALGWWAYSAGLAQAAAQGGTQLAPQTGPVAVVPFWPWGYPWFGFGPLGCLIPLAILFFVFALIRPLIWFGMGGHRHEDWAQRGPFMGRRHHWREMAEEWHRQAHANQGSDAPEEKPSGT